MIVVWLLCRRCWPSPPAHIFILNYRHVHWKWYWIDLPITPHPELAATRLSVKELFNVFIRTLRVRISQRILRHCPHPSWMFSDFPIHRGISVVGAGWSGTGQVRVLGGFQGGFYCVNAARPLKAQSSWRTKDDGWWYFVATRGGKGTTGMEWHRIVDTTNSSSGSIERRASVPDKYLCR